MSKPEVKILAPGYVSAENNGRSCSTISLVRSNKYNIIVDPGTSNDQQAVIDALKKVGLSVADINVVFITHSHIDHYRNVGLFPQAKVLEYYGWWEGDLYSEYKNGDLGENIEIINTPGHSKDSLTMLVKSAQGAVAICGDVFWKKDFPKHDQYAENQNELEKSRQKVLGMADYIIPGHGDIYRCK